MQDRSPSVAYFGKVPTHGDFVRHRAGGPAWRALDEWIRRGLGAVAPQHRASLEEATRGMEPMRFLFASEQDGAFLAGALAPSHDRVGRFYPFVVAAEQAAPSAEVGQLARLPVQQSEYLDRAVELAWTAASGELEPCDLPGMLPPLQAALLHSSEADGYEAYVQETTLKAFAERLWGHSDDGRKYLLLKNLLDVLLPFKSAPGMRLTFGLQFPLSAGSAAHAAGFWWELCSRLVQPSPTRPACFWREGAPGQALMLSLTLFLQPPPARAFQALLRMDDGDEYVFDLERVGLEETAVSASDLPPRYGQMVESETLTLREMLQQV